MLPSIPSSLLPVTAQQDSSKPRPEVSPITPVVKSAAQSAVTQGRHQSQEMTDDMNEQRGHRHTEHMVENPIAESVDAAMEEIPRQGTRIDIKI
ncbi:aspartate-semialdehyde dehydrogenase [Azomonas macrocytogenes]|uniref:Uncharacterized protein n=1 Tax=Azomonas macrocytogenes TaxID=69962 RepID=A0A839SY57_AZOMA|nr:aspartate-semialdehyde dehydrogenase [Azomonas macrocytogenes]MBB3102291.1 hypothetical protein [Azomonas macrocytogenes]